MSTFVILPSFSQQRIERLSEIMDIHYYEAEMLFTLLLLRDNDVVYVSSMPIPDYIVDYYLDLLPDPEGARDRLTLIPLDDTRPIPLVSKLMADTDALDLVKGALPGREACLFPLDITEIEQSLATALGIEIYGPSPGLARFGTKSGSRQAARESGVRVPLGAADVRSFEEIEQELERLRDEHSVRRAVIKLDRGFGGEGNAVVDLTSSPLPDAIADSQEEQWWRAVAERISVEGGVVEELIDEPDTTFPSVQLKVSFDGTAAVISTHDQLVGGHDKQIYMGAAFPADAAYRRLIEGEALKVGKTLSSLGIRGTFGIDFIVVGRGGRCECFLNEINLRLTASVRSFVTAKYVTGGEYDSGLGALETASGPRVYVAADALWSDEWRGRDVRDLIAGLDARGIAYDKEARRGIVLHLLPSLSDHGRFAALCIADSRDGAEDLLRALRDFARARHAR